MQQQCCIASPSGTTKVTLKAEQTINREILGTLFGYIPKTVVLLSKEGNVLTAEEDGSFAVDSVSRVHYWECFGTSQPEQVQPPEEFKYLYQPGRGDSYGGCCSGYSRGKGKQGKVWKSKRVPPGVLNVENERNIGQEWMKSVELCQWNGLEKRWDEIQTLPVKLREDTANVEAVTRMVSADGFDGKEVVLLDLKFLKVMDVSSTKGMGYSFLLLAYFS